MAKTSLAKAYVQIVPSAEGIQGSISNVLNNESSTAGKSAGSMIASSIKKMIIAGGLGKALMSALTEGANLQQSIGGIETLFKESSDAMKKYAQEAYKTAGISANTYMEQATSFSASLLQSLAGDTAKAAKAANQAIIDMADNSNKMGTSLEMIQNAYQGFAKQNYTMLDNLKLGYGGTKTEMERLLQDAQKLTGIKYDISNLNDVYSAIHVIQGELGITGTTATEAEKTLSGSFASMKSSAKNFLGNLTLGEDIKPSLKALVSTTSTFLVDNLVPAVCNIVFSLPEAIGTVIEESVPRLLEEGQQLIESIIVGMQIEFPKILQNGTEMLNSFITGILDNTPNLLSNIGEMMIKLSNAIIQNLPTILECGVSIVSNLLKGIIRNLPQILESGIKLVGEFGAGIIRGIPKLLGKALTIFNEVKREFASMDWKSIGKNLLDGIINGISGAVGSLIKAAKNAATSALNAIKNKLGIHSPSRVFENEVGKMIPPGLAKGIEGNLKPVQDAMDSLSAESIGMMNSDFNMSKRLIIDGKNHSTSDQLIDYNKFAETLLQVLKYLKIELDDEEVGRFIDERLLEVL